MIFRLLPHIEDIEASQWQSLVGAQHSPFLEHHWLASFETSGSMSPDSGWQPLHLLGFKSDHDADRTINPVFALPLYLKNHSWGEFVFDFAWADVASQLGQEYYPKAVGVIPATPVTAYQALDSSGDPGSLAQAVEYLEKRLPEMGVKSLSFLFAEDDFADRLESLGFSRWIHQGFVWTRDGMNDFQDYLDSFRKNQRKNIRKERQSITEQELTVRIIGGDELCAEDADDMFELYEKTNDQFGPWAAKFLNRDFFRESFKRCAHQILLVSAFDSRGLSVGCSMLVHKGSKLYGRYWGSRDFFKDLHFNLCYYEPIDYAIRQGIDWFDPGMGGEHKLRRGFHGVRQHSMHRFFDPVMDRIFSANIGQFNRHAITTIDAINDSLPQKPR